MSEVPGRDTLPRLLIISDVNVERAAGGSLVLYRLLSEYPAERIYVCARPFRSWDGPTKRLDGVTYRDLEYKTPRYIHSRFNPFWPLWQARYVTRYQQQVISMTNSFRPQAVMSVAHGFLWFVASAVAKRLGLPLHLILHDDWPFMNCHTGPEWLRPRVVSSLESLVRKQVTSAERVYAVSPGMAEKYPGRSCILYPSRGEDSPVPRLRLCDRSARPFVLAYAGMIHQHSIARMLAELSTQLKICGGILDLYTPYSSEKLAGFGLNQSNIRRVGFFSAKEMADRVGRTAQGLFLPASFAPSDARDASTLFPSKLADYTAIGLPLLIWGPEYSSAARWALDNPAAALLVTNPDPQKLSERLLVLSSGGSALTHLAEASISAGARDFSADAIRSRFYDMLLTPNTSRMRSK